MDDGSGAGSPAGKDEKKGKNKDTVETSLQKLEDILAQLEKEETPLEESFQLYTRGMKLVKDINSSIDKIEKKMIVLEGEDHV